MANHSSATARRETSHVNRTSVEEISETNADDSHRKKIEMLIGMICGAGGEASSALLVLMAMLQNSADPNAVANTAKHLAFTYCGELNVNGMVDAQAALFEGELLAGNRLAF